MALEKVLTIIVPAYNMEQYLGKCLESLMMEREKMSLLEVIVVNDGSKDATLKIAQSYKDKYPDVFKIIDKENGNYGSCINRGLAVASGKYVKILDADDYFSTESLCNFLAFLASATSNLVVSPYVRVDASHSNKEKIISWNIGGKTMDITDPALSQILFSKDFQMHAVTYRKDIFEGWDYHQTEGLSYTDQEWMFTPMSCVRTVAYFGEPLYYYLNGRDGQTMNWEVQRRQVSHNVKGLYKMLSDYTQMKVGSKVMDNYLLLRLDQRASHIYKIYLLNDLPIDELTEVDNQIKVLAPDYYHRMDQLVVHQIYPYRFIRGFRMHRRKTLLFNIYRCYMSLNS